jgi:hypothetical protein
MKRFSKITLISLLCAFPALLNATNPEPAGTVNGSSPGCTITNDESNVSFYRGGICPNGFAWSEATLWLLSGEIVLGNQYTQNGTSTITGESYLTQGAGTYSIQYRLVDVDYNYTDQWLTIGVSQYSTPTYDPSFWTQSSYTQDNNNCYNYANNVQNNTYAQPGYAHGYTFTQSQISGSVLSTGIYDDHLSSSSGSGYTQIALMIDAGVDFHFARLDSTNTWSHKPGETAPSNVDASHASIFSPSIANWNYTSVGGLNYSYYADDYFTPSDVVEGDGHADISGSGIGSIE